MNVVITGANRGLGLELTRQYLSRGDSVHAGVRTPDRPGALAELSSRRLRIDACDVASEASVRSFAAAVTEPVDLLINNAGVRSRPDELDGLDPAEALRTFQVNALGSLLVSAALLPMLRRAPGAKIVCMSSDLGSIDGNTSGGVYGYRMSKAALNMASRSLAHDLRSDGIIAVALSPGWVQTDMGGANAPLQVADSVAGMIAVIDRLTPEDSGGFFGLRGERIAW
jgi:NAD(P)-dependent dehydrogenase (short-subunit alcohol dehydrogenase family)